MSRMEFGHYMDPGSGQVLIREPHIKKRMDIGFGTSH